MLYALYGLTVESSLRLNAPPLRGGRPDVRISKAPSSFFKSLLSKIQDTSRPVDYHPLPGDAVYIRFFDVFRFWVSPDGKRILYQKQKSGESRQKPYVSPVIFLQTNVLSFSLIKLGIETFHASCIAFGDKAVAFLGESGYGKSTLAASFLKKGFPLLTDDVLAVRSRDGKFWTPPGAAQIKLYPEALRKILGKFSSAGKMSPIAHKKILMLQQKAMGRKAGELGLLYVLWPRFDREKAPVRIRKLKAHEGVINLIKSSHNLVLQDGARLRTQMSFAARLARKVPVRALSFPMDFGKIPQVRDAVLKDASRILRKI